MDSAPLQPSPPGSPFANEPEQLRLGIIHLMGWAASTAVYFSLYRIMVFGRPDPLTVFTIISVFAGLGIGAAWGGLLIYLSRRCRGIPFPVAPGEILLVALGVISLLSTGVCGLSNLPEFLAGGDEGYMTYYMYMLSQFFGGAVSAVVYRIAGTKTSVVRWRVFFYSSAALSVVVLLMTCVEYGLYSGSFVYYLFATSRLILLAVVFVDIRKGLRYPWTHWLGVAVHLLFGAAHFATALTLTLFPNQ